MSISSEVKSLKLNGNKVAIIDGSFSYILGGVTREPVMGSGRVLDFTDAVTAGSCTFDIAYLDGTDLKSFDVTGAQISVTWNNNKTMLMKRSSLTEPPSGAAPSGAVSLAYSGDPWRV